METPSFTRRLAWAALAGLFASLGRPGFDLAPCYFLGLIALSFLAQRSPTVWQALLLGVTWGLCIVPSIALGAITWGVFVPISLTGIGIVLYPIPFALLSYAIARRLSAVETFVVVATGWSLWMEVGDFVGFPLKGTALSLLTFSPWLLGGVRLVGANVMCGLLAATCVSVAYQLARFKDPGTWSVLRPAVKAALPGLSLVLALAVLAHVTAPAPRATVKVGIPQINVDNLYYESRLSAPALVEAFDGQLRSLLSRLREAELIAFPEAFDGAFTAVLPSKLRYWQEYAKRQRQALLLTSYAVEPDGRKSNVILGIDARGDFVGAHKKVHLAPYGEATLAAGAGYRPLSLLPGVSVGPFICHESFLPAAGRELSKLGATLQVVATSDVSFGSSILVFEHVAMTALRSIENGRATVWSSNAGPSGLITRWGELTHAGPYRETAALSFTAPLYDDQTPFAALAWIWPWLCLAGLVVIIVPHARAFRHPFERAIPTAAQPNAPPRSVFWQAWPLVVALSAGLGLCLTSPMLLQLKHGKRERALDAIPETLIHEHALVQPGGFDGYAAGEGETVRGALALWLSYYGLQSSASGIPGDLADHMELARVSDGLREHLGISTRILPLNEESFPRVHTLVRLKQGGYGVLSRPGSEPPTLFLPAARSASPMGLPELMRIIEPSGLIPETGLLPARHSMR